MNSEKKFFKIGPYRDEKKIASTLMVDKTKPNFILYE